MLATGQSSGYSASTPFLVQTNWPMFGFNIGNNRFNPYENVLTTSNVSNLTLDWSYTAGNSIVSSPAVVNGVVFIGSHDGSLYAFDAATGVLLWSYATSGPILSSPVVANGIVYIGSYDHNLYALNANTGILLWSYTTGLFIESPPLIANGVVYVGSDDWKLYALNATTQVPSYGAIQPMVISDSPRPQ